MEQKCLKTSVYVNDTVFKDSLEQPIDVDFSLPDYCPDISKIFKCQAVPRIASKGINGKTVSIEGNICITLIYADKDGNLCSFEYNYPFSKTAEMQSESASANLSAKIRIEYINCRAVTGRKVDIHGAAGIFIKVFKRKCADIISDYDDTNIELKRGIAPATVPMGYAEKYLLIEDELSVGAGQPAARNIIRSDAKATVKETKVINGKAVVKGEMTVCVIYCPETAGGLQSVKSVIPFSQIIDIDGINDSCSCESRCEMAYFEAKPRNTAGEIKSFNLTAKLLLSSEAYCGNDIAVILDAFSRKYEAEIKRNRLCFEKINYNISENYHCKKSIELPETISSVIDLWCNIQGYNTRFEKDGMVIAGTLVGAMIICNENGSSIYYEKPIDFEYKYPLETQNAILSCEPQLEIISCGYTITSESNMELRIDLGINACIYEKNEISLISEMNVDETKPCKKRYDGALMIYYPTGKECVWDIARIYNASTEEIMKINELSNEELPMGKMILVPMG